MRFHACYGLKVQQRFLNAFSRLLWTEVRQRFFVPFSRLLWTEVRQRCVVF
ncbi:MAG: hypothetical protein VKK42_04675 [Lyngbya sp.]|nr:hypothetical protein [Lyngbya sp.]